MKQNIFFLIVFSVLLISCDKVFQKNSNNLSSISTVSVDTSSLPKTVLQYVSTNYPNLSLSSAEQITSINSSSYYKLRLSNGTVVRLDSNGSVVGERSIYSTYNYGKKHGRGGKCSSKGKHKSNDSTTTTVTKTSN